MQRGLSSLSTNLFRSLITGGSPRCVSRLPSLVHIRRSSVILNHLCSFASKPNMSYSIVEKGAPNSLDYRIFFCAPGGNIISPFHDIPLYANKEASVFNMVVEIPRWTNAKMEIAKSDKLNPIKQDVKKGNLRYVKNIFPHHGYIWNYGALPQTWEDPAHVDPSTSAKGDSDPIDVCEIGSTVHKRGSVIQVKILGTMCLIDEGETDWKVIAIDVTDPLAAEFQDIEDVDRKMPGFLKATYEWFKYYKVPDGKPVNAFAFDGEAKNKEFALDVISKTHEQWQNLVNNADNRGMACENTLVAGSPHQVSQTDAQGIVESSPQGAQSIEPGSDLDKWYYVIP